MKRLIGVGVMLETSQGTYLLQERDHNTTMHPGKIAPFGGGIEGEETATQCAQRELLEELSIDVREEQLLTIGLLESRNDSDEYIHMFLVREVVPSLLLLQEGKAIAELSKEDALANEQVTDFTKEILRSI